MIARLALALLLALLAWPAAQAHEGHAGPPVTELKDRAALKALLPQGAKLAKRKQRLSDQAIEAIRKQYGHAPETGLVTYYLARDRESGATLAAALIDRVPYRHGKIKLAVGLDAQGRLTGAAVLSVNEKYLPDVKSAVGTGLLEGYRGLSLEELIQRAERADDEAERAVLTGLRDMALRLAALL